MQTATQRVAGMSWFAFNLVQILTESLATSLRYGWCLLDLTRVKSGRACLPRQARQPRSPGREGFRARSTLKSVHWTDLTPPGRGRALPRQARPDLPAIGVRRIPCLPPCGVQQSGREFPHRGTACPTLGPMSPCQCRQAVSVKPGNVLNRFAFDLVDQIKRKTHHAEWRESLGLPTI